MATTRQDFDSYKIWHYSGHSHEALIHCFHGGVCVGEISFFKDDMPMPTNQITRNRPCINYPISRFNDIISILRYEKPLCIFLNLSNNIGIVATSDQEPVGEEES